ncbi:MAG: hypothetical protein ACI8X5_003308 [Planctomycetota bacterium]|jgi:hypothetical protein
MIGTKTASMAKAKAGSIILAKEPNRMAGNSGSRSNYASKVRFQRASYCSNSAKR